MFRFEQIWRERRARGSSSRQLFKFITSKNWKEEERNHFDDNIFSVCILRCSGRSQRSATNVSGRTRETDCERGHISSALTFLFFCFNFRACAAHADQQSFQRGWKVIFKTASKVERHGQRPGEERHNGAVNETVSYQLTRVVWLPFSSLGRIQIEIRQTFPVFFFWGGGICRSR